MIKNKIEKPFGPAGTAMGIFMFIGGIVMSYFSLIGLALVIPGAFIGFTYESTFIDFNKNRVKNVNSLFGIIPIGKWIAIKPTMKLGLKKIHRGYRTMTRGNSNEFHKTDFRILLYNSNNKKITQIKKLNSLDEAKKNIETLSKQLELVII